MNLSTFHDNSRLAICYTWHQYTATTTVALAVRSSAGQTYQTNQPKSWLQMKGIIIIWLLISMFLPGARPENCQNIGWKGDRVNILDDCSIFEDDVTIFLTRMLDRQDCVNKVTLKIEGYSWILDSKHYGNFSRGKWVLTHEIKPKDRCEKVKLKLWIESLHYGSSYFDASTGLYQSYPDSYHSSFMLDPKDCFKLKKT